ncbi:MAG: hypothetical protein IJ586_00010 [Alloprevotella sp.]|nr:hypothetical protein [Alloprevotella sp.]
MESLTGPNLLTFGVVLLALVATWNTLWTGWKNVREARKPQDDLRAMVESHGKMLAKDKERLDDLEESNRLVLRAISQLIEHELTGNHNKQLTEVKDDINDYLINR